MAVLFPLACVVLAALLGRRRVPSVEHSVGWREAAVGGAVAAGVFAVAIAELTSLFRLFDRTAVTALWTAAAVMLAVLVLRRRSRIGGQVEERWRFDPAQKALLLGFAAFAAAIGATAWAAAPNNWDSLTYHLPRAAHWIENGGVDHYPTHILRQLTLGPGAEFFDAELELLQGSDRFVAFIQAFAWLGSAAAASLVAKGLGAGSRGQVLSAVFAATLPMALLQASSTQNDLVLSFWLLAFAHFCLRVFRGEAGIASWLLVGGSLGLALLTKATATLFAFPFAAALLLVPLRRRRRWDRGGLVLAILVALLVNAGAWSRNLALFGTPLGGEHGAVNTAFAPSILVSNLARNVALQLASPWRSWNERVEDAVTGIHGALGIDASDPRSTWRGAEFHVPARLSGAGPADSDEALFAAFHEDQAANPLHFFLLIIAAALVIAHRALRGRGRVIGYLAALAGGFLLFSLVLKWQPWGARLELPLLLLGAPLAGVVWSGEGREHSARWPAAISALLLLTSVPWVFSNATRPLLGIESVWTAPRLTQSFANRPLLAPPLTEAAAFVAARGCRRIGLEIGPDDPEYLVWLSLRAAGAPPDRLEHVDVKNRSAVLAANAPFAGFSPCAVIGLSPPGAGRPEGSVFARAWAGGWVFVRTGTGSP